MDIETNKNDWMKNLITNTNITKEQAQKYLKGLPRLDGEIKPVRINNTIPYK